MRSYALLSLGALGLAQAATFDIDAGEHGFSYVPDTINPKVGDTINVHYYPGPHDFTQSSFDAPCQPLAGGISSGTVPSNSGQASMMFTFNVTTTDTMWFYCGTPGHCSAGMSMVFNPPSSGNTLAAYQKAANGQPGAIPNGVSGGQLVANVDNDDDENSSSSSSSASASASASSSASGSAPASASASATASSSASGAASSSGSSPQATFTGNAASNFGVVPLMMLAPAAAYLFS